MECGATRILDVNIRCQVCYYGRTIYGLEQKVYFVHYWFGKNDNYEGYNDHAGLH